LGSETQGANDDNLFVPRNLLKPSLEFIERDVVGPTDLPISNLVGFTHVQQKGSWVAVKQGH
jgi:hypothetical protein